MDALQPGQSGAGGGKPSGLRGASPQAAVKILSLRVPERVSQGAIAPLPLINGKGGSAAAGAQGLDSMVAALMQAFRPQTPMGAGPQVPTYQPPSNTYQPPSGGGGNYGEDPDEGSDSDIWRVPSRDPGNPRPPIGPVGYPEPGRSPAPNNPPPPIITFPHPDQPGPILEPDPGPASPKPRGPDDPGWYDERPRVELPQNPGGWPDGGGPWNDFPGPEPGGGWGPIEQASQEEAPSLFNDQANEQPWWMQKNEGLFNNY